MIYPVPIDCIEPSPWQARRRQDEEHVAALAESIRGAGQLLQVPMGRPIEGTARVQLAFGSTRLAACRLLGWTDMPVDVRPMSDRELFLAGLRENLSRKDLGPLDQARAMQACRKEFNLTSKEIGELFRLSSPAVRNKIRLLNLGDMDRDRLAQGKITEGQARGLLARDRGLGKAETELAEAYLVGEGAERLATRLQSLATGMLRCLHRSLDPEIQPGPNVSRGQLATIVAGKVLMAVVPSAARRAGLQATMVEVDEIMAEIERGGQ